MVLPCLQRGTAIKIDGCQSKDAKHPRYSMAAGIKFDLASVICKSVRQMYIICQITNVDAMIGQVVCSVVYDLGELHRAVRCDLLMPKGTELLSPSIPITSTTLQASKRK